MERADFEQWKPREVARLLALVETERRYYQEIVANIPVSLLVVGSGLAIVSANRQFRVNLGKKNDEILGRQLEELVSMDGVVELARSVVGTGLAVPKLETVWELGGVAKKVTLTALPLRRWEDDSELEALLVIHESVGAEKSKAEEVAASVEGMLWEVDFSAGGITYVSAAAQELFGYPVEQWLGDPAVWGLRVAEAERMRVDAFYSLIGGSAGKDFAIEFLARNAGGREFQVRESVRVERDEQGKAVKLYGFTTSIGERRELEEQQLVAHKSEALQRLSAKLAHDLNNLLMIVAGYGEELKNSLPADNPLHQDMGEILGATQRLYSLTTQMQAYTRRPVTVAKITSIAALVAQARPKLEKALGEVKLEVEVAEGLSKAKVDGAQIEEALLCLARHAALEMGGTGSLRIGAGNVLRGEEIGVEGGLKAGAYVRLTIEQSGSPMSGEARERMLEPWLYTDEHVREIKMGLNTAYQILRQSHGDLSVEVEEGKGTCFRLYLPMVSQAELEAERALATAQVVATPVIAQVPGEPETTLETILVVEDEGGIRALVRKILKRQGYHVLEASHGAEALQVLADAGGKVDLLLTDVMMPGMNGVELSYKALEAKADLKVLFVSGYTDESLLEAGQFPAGTAFLQKPFTLGSLLGKVREVLDGTASRRAAS